MPVFKFNSSVSTQSYDILANYVASSVQSSDVTFSDRSLRCHQKGHKTRKASDDLKARLWNCKEVEERTV